jgi:23S rRNA pseudouridine1911/1915/1917 synthase
MNDFLTSPDEAEDGDEALGTVRRSARVPMALAGQRLDAAMASMFPEFSRSRLAAWIKDGAAQLDGRPAQPRAAVRGGEEVRIDAQLEPVSSAGPEPIPLSLLHVDEHLLVVDKPPGLVVHPGAGNPTGTLVNALLHFDPALAALPRAGIVHRLDKDTSGCLLVARTLQAHAALVAQLAERDIHRQYEAVVVGALVAGGTVDAPIDRHASDRLKMTVRAGGRPAVTHYRLRQRFRAHSLLQVQLETGRTHQIRVHMAHIRHPIVGDPLYGGGLRLPKGASDALVEALRSFQRQALHAERLAFEHPLSGEPIVAEAPRPADLQRLVEALAADAARVGNHG